jgi:hypothetical protein
VRVADELGDVEGVGVGVGVESAVEELDGVMVFDGVAL